MNEAAVKSQLDALSKAIMSLPAAPSKKGFEEGLNLAGGCEGGSSLEGALEILRLQVKYLLFDLEATRRENRYLRRMLEARPPHDKDKDGEDK